MTSRRVSLVGMLLWMVATALLAMIVLAVALYNDLRDAWNYLWSWR